MTLLKISAAALVAASLLVSSGAIAATSTTTAKTTMTTKTTTTAKVAPKTTAMAKPAAKIMPKATHAPVPAVMLSMGKPAGVATLADMTTWLTSFDPTALTALDSAKSVTVYYYNKSWTGADKAKASGLLKTDKASIDALHVALAKDAKAEALLKAHHIKTNNVVGVFDVKGSVELYIL